MEAPGGVTGHVAVLLRDGTIRDPTLRDNLEALGARVDDILPNKSLFSKEEWGILVRRFPDLDATVVKEHNDPFPE